MLILCPIRKPRKPQERASILCLGITEQVIILQRQTVSISTISHLILYLQFYCFSAADPRPCMIFVYINRKICLKRILLSNKLFQYIDFFRLLLLLLLLLFYDDDHQRPDHQTKSSQQGRPNACMMMTSRLTGRRIKISIFKRYYISLHIYILFACNSNNIMRSLFIAIFLTWSD